MKRNSRLAAVLGFAAAGISLATQNVGAVNWDSVKGKDVTLFFPGQASWEWVLSDHSASKTVRKGGHCRECHDTEEPEMGNKMVAGKKLEPAPIAGKPGSVPINVKAMHDADRLYVRVQWKDTGFHSGKKMDDQHPVKIALMMADKSVKESTIAGCWGACHDDATGMASAGDAKRALYLSGSRSEITRKGGGDAIKPDAQLDTLLAAGNFMEFWQAEVRADQKVDANDGYVLEKRNKSKTPLVESTAQLKDGVWSVVLSRKLKVNEKGHRSFESGQPYNIGFALHDDYASGRIHYVSFGYTLALDSGDADFVARKQ